MLRPFRGSQWLLLTPSVPGAFSHLQGLWQHLSQAQEIPRSHTAQQGPLPVCQASLLHTSWGLQPIEGAGTAPLEKEVTDRSPS